MTLDLWLFLVSDLQESAALMDWDRLQGAQAPGSHPTKSLQQQNEEFEEYRQSSLLHYREKGGVYSMHPLREIMPRFHAEADVSLAHRIGAEMLVLSEQRFTVDAVQEMEPLIEAVISLKKYLRLAEHSGIERAQFSLARLKREHASSLHQLAGFTAYHHGLSSLHPDRVIDAPEGVLVIAPPTLTRPQYRIMEHLFDTLKR